MSLDVSSNVLYCQVYINSMLEISMGEMYIGGKRITSSGVRVNLCPQGAECNSFYEGFLTVSSVIEICPPVPPPALIYLSLSLTTVYLLLCSLPATHWRRVPNVTR